MRQGWPLTFEGSRYFSNSGSADLLRKLHSKYVIACTSRTASTLLSIELARFGVLAFEHFDELDLVAARDRGVLSLSDYVSDRIAQTAFNGQWAIKGTFGIVEQLARLGEIPKYLNEWRFIYLTRKNLVQQAISIVIAETSGSWVSWGISRRSVAAEAYDEERIASTIDIIVDVNACWERFFGVFGITPLRLTFEDILNDTAGCVARARTYLGLADKALEKHPPAIVAEMRKYLGLKDGEMGESSSSWKKPSSQRSEINKIWEERFRADRARALESVSSVL